MHADKPLVLVADDEQNAVVLLRRILEREGFAVESAEDGITTLEKARLLKPDLILLDVQMPRLNGFEVTARLREDPETARIPVIFVTAAARDASDVAHGFQLGADDYIRKPYDYHELLARAISKMRARQLEDRLQRRNAELEALVRIGAEFNLQLSPLELMERIIRIAVEEFTADYAELLLFDETGVPVSYVDTSRGERNPQEVHALLHQDDTVVSHVFKTGAPVLIHEPQRQFAYMASLGLQSAIASPLHHHGKLTGILIAAHREPAHFSESDLRMMRLIGEQAALAIRNAQLHAALQEYAQNLAHMVAERTKELRAAQAQLIQTEKLAALGRLAAGIAHEVNNPLQPILNCLEDTIEDLERDHPIDPRGLRIAEQEVQRIKGIVSRLLDFARPSTSEKHPVELAALVREILVLTRRQMERANIQIETRLHPVRPVLGSPAQLKQVLLNLILNAAEAMEGGGKLAVEIFPDNNGAVFAVTDTGTGMDKDTLEHIFEPFYSTKGDGTGLGLSVTYGIVKGHGGEIRVESEIGKGSRFTVWLPCERDSDAR